MEIIDAYILPGVGIFTNRDAKVSTLDERRSTPSEAMRHADLSAGQDLTRTSQQTREASINQS